MRQSCHLTGDDVWFFSCGDTAWMTTSHRQDTARRRGHEGHRGSPTGRASLRTTRPADLGLPPRFRPAHAARRALRAAPLCSAVASCRYLSPLTHGGMTNLPGGCLSRPPQPPLRPHLRCWLGSEVSNCQVTSPQEGLFCFFSSPSPRSDTEAGSRRLTLSPPGPAAEGTRQLTGAEGPSRPLPQGQPQWGGDPPLTPLDPRVPTRLQRAVPLRAGPCPAAVMCPRAPLLTLAAAERVGEPGSLPSRTYLAT